MKERLQKILSGRGVCSRRKAEEWIEAGRVTCNGIVAQLGDLSFSLIKREFGIKDYGKLFLEHGGVLDRFDSVLFVAPVLSVLLSYVNW